jgi:hypothetical protein
MTSPLATTDGEACCARLFKDYGLVVIEFDDAGPCYNRPKEVVDDFLGRLRA